MKYTEHSLRQVSGNKFIADWAFKEGVFLTPQRKWIARVLKPSNNYVTLSQHSKKEDAEKVYNDFYKN